MPVANNVGLGAAVTAGAGVAAYQAYQSYQTAREAREASAKAALDAPANDAPDRTWTTFAFADMFSS